MSDRVTGVAVRYKDDKGLEHLRIQCETVAGKFAGRVEMETIPVYRVGTPKPSDCAWAYRQDGGMLNVTPSVRVSTSYPVDDRMVPVELFHNEGAWSVRFVDATGPDDSVLVYERDNPRPERHHD